MYSAAGLNGISSSSRGRSAVTVISGLDLNQK